MKIRFEKVDPLPPKEQWYRIEEREGQNCTPQSVYREGDWIEFERTIVRAGYYWQPEDMPIELLEQRTNNHIHNLANAYLKSKLNFEQIWYGGFHGDHELWWNKPKDEEPITDDVVNAVLTAVEQTPEHLLKHLFYRIRGEWVREQKEHKNLRTFWYVDQKDARQVDTIVRKQIGTRNEGFMGYDGDFQPPYFSQQSSHLLYQMGWYGDNWACKRGQWHVHPLDIMENDNFSMRPQGDI